MYFHFLVCVLFDPPIVSLDDPPGPDLIGYYQNFIVKARTAEEAKGKISSFIEDGSIDWAETEIQQVSLHDIPTPARSSLERAPVVAFGGRALFDG